MTYLVDRSKASPQGTEGWHDARCIAVQKLGNQHRPYMEPNESRPLTKLAFELDETDPQVNRIVKPWEVTESLTETANLYAAACALLGVNKLPGDPAQPFDLDSLVGKICRVRLEARTSRRGQTFCDIKEASPLQSQPAVSYAPPNAPPQTSVATPTRLPF